MMCLDSLLVVDWESLMVLVMVNRWDSLKEPGMGLMKVLVLGHYWDNLKELGME